MSAPDPLAAALDRDDQREAAGAHPDLRDTCWSCQSWADHAHDISGRRITLDEHAELWADREPEA